VPKSIEEVKGTTKKLLSTQGNRTVTEFMRELAPHVEQLRDGAQQGIPHEAIAKIPAIRDEFWQNVKVSGTGAEFNQQLRTPAHSGLHGVRRASLPGRAPPQRIVRWPLPGGVPVRGRRGEARRRELCLCGRWEFKGVDKEPELHKEPLKFENIHLAGKELQIMSAQTPDTIDEREIDRLAAKGSERARPVRNPRRQGDHRAPLLPRDARRGERGPDQAGKDPIAFDHDCREGICGTCSAVVNGSPTAGRCGPPSASSTCGSSRTATRSISNRGGPAFPIVRDLVSTAARWIN